MPPATPDPAGAGKRRRLTARGVDRGALPHPLPSTPPANCN